MSNLCFFGHVAGRMRTIHEDDRMKYLLKVRAKKSQPAKDQLDPLTQFEVADGDASKKKKRKVEQGRISVELSSKGSGFGEVLLLLEARWWLSLLPRRNIFWLVKKKVFRLVQARKMG
jgi:hypothetical protein